MKTSSFAQPYKLSIVTPSYNQGQFLEETICSVLDQKYQNLEYIIIDGGSKDNSIEIIKKYEKHLKYWVSEKDHGQAEAINKGFRQCTGDIMAWINSDDLYFSDAFQYVNDFFCNSKNLNVGMIYGDAWIVDANNEFIMHRKELPFDRWMGMLIGFGLLIPQPAAFWRRSVYEAVGLLKENLHYCLDSDYWSRISKTFRIQHANKYLAKARYHADAKTNLLFKGNTRKGYDELNQELEASYTSFAISKIVKFKYSSIIRKSYRIKRILMRAVLGHYFWDYKTAWKQVK